MARKLCERKATKSLEIVRLPNRRLKYGMAKVQYDHASFLLAGVAGDAPHRTPVIWEWASIRRPLSLEEMQSYITILNRRTQALRAIQGLRMKSTVGQ